MWYFVIALCLVIALFYLRVKLIVWVSASIAFLLVITMVGHYHLLTLSLMWIVVLGILAIVSFPSLRLSWFTRRAFNFAKKQLPKISPSEREALKAGTVTWDGQLFTGMPNWQMLFDYIP